MSIIGEIVKPLWPWGSLYLNKELAFKCAFIS
jgi:hypothetical protein